MKPSLSASALKYLALVTMLLDHMAYYLALPVPLRWIGRLAAPIFLFFVVEGFCHTHDIKKYILRMYAVAAAMGVINALLQAFASGFRPDGITPTNGICATFFLLLLLLQGTSLVRRQKWQGIVMLIVPFVLPQALYALLPAQTATLLTTTLLPSPYNCEGGMEFLVLGALFYLFREKRTLQLTVYASASLVLYLVPVLVLGGGALLLTYYQWLMVFAVIPLAMYNGQRGTAPRWLFYWFYPVHIYLLWALGAIL